MSRRTASLLASSFLIAVPAVSVAQTADGGNALDIVVTAQKREENLISVPLAISAQTGETLQAKGISRVEQLAQTTPGLQINHATGNNQIYLRGIGNSLFASAAESSIAVYIDDVPRPRSASANEMSNVQRVEVLRGPQGALYGRNASGGAINIVTKKPSNTFEANGSVSVGEYDTTEAAAYVNVPVTDAIAANFSMTRRTHDAFLTNVGKGTTGNDEFDEDFWSIDSKVRVNPTDSLDVIFAYDYARKDDANGFGWQQQRYDQTLGYYNALLTAFGLPNTPPGFTLERDLGKRLVSEDQEAGTKNLDRGGSIRAVQSFETMDLTFVTSYRKHVSNQNVEIDATPIPIAGFEAWFQSNTTTAEVRLASTTDSKFGWLFGGSYFKDENKERLEGIVLGFRNPAFDLDVKQDIEAFAGFTQLSYKVTDALSLIGSLRVTSEKKDIIYPAQVANGLLAITAQKKESKVIPSITANYQLDDDQLVYARYAKGYKSGGFNTLLNPAALPGAENRIPNRFKPELVDTFELGYKGRVADGKGQITAALFYNDIQDIQISRTGGPGVTNYILNASKARTYGAELGVAWIVTQGLTLNASGAYINSKYKDYSSPGLPTLGILPFDNNGNQMQQTPEWSASVGADYEQPITDSLKFAAQANVAYASKYNLEAQDDPALEIKAHTLVNARVGMKGADDKVGFYLFARNLFNEYYYQAGQSNAAGILLTPAPPRVIGVTLEAAF